MTAFSHWASALIICLTLLYPSVSKSQSRPLSVVVLHSGQNETTVRLAAELSALGYSAVLLLHPSQAMWTDQVRAIIRNYRAAALINAASLKTRVDIWFPTPGTAGMQLTVDTVDAAEGGNNIAATILKTVEALRAGLMKMDGANPTRVADRNGKTYQNNINAPAQTEVRADGSFVPSYPRGKISRHKSSIPFVTDPGRLSLMLGPAMTYGFADFPPEWQIQLSLGVAFGRFLSITLSGFAPTAPLRFENEYGKARVWNGALLLGLKLGLRSNEKRLVPFIELGLGPHFSRMKGEGNPPYSNGDDRITVLETLFRFGLRVWFTSRIGIDSALHIGDCLPKPVVKVGEEDATFTRPLFGASVLLTVELF